MESSHTISHCGLSPSVSILASVSAPFPATTSTSYPVAFLNISGIISSKSFKYTTSGLVWDTFPAVSATVVVSAAIVPAAVVVSEAAVVSAVFAPQPVMDAAAISPAMVSAVSLIFFIMCFLLQIVSAFFFYACLSVSVFILCVLCKIWCRHHLKSV